MTSGGSRMRQFTGMVALTAALAVGLAAFTQTPALAQKYPERPVKIVLPFGAGGVADVTTRLVAEKLGDKLGQRFVVENMPGAGGITAARSVMQATPDGYTLALFSNGTAVSVGLFKSLPFDPLKDFRPVGNMGYFDLVFVSSVNSPYKTLEDFIKAAKASPGKLNIGTIAAGSSQNLGAELFKSTAGIDVAIVPFKNSGDVSIALERNDIQLGVEFYAALRPSLESKKFIPLATSGLTPVTYLKDVPTVKQAAGLDFEATSWNAIYAPKGVSDDIVKTLNTALNEVLNDPTIKQKANDMGIVAKGSTPEALNKRLTDDIAKWSAVIQKAGIEKR
ncbi:MAG: tripartite tricarboxylate transporter substrate binding protein [Pseudolabrys sp.]|nr:tripartite tricarboxylate transporter substrate binding protein [Pseudolabrys sp.]